MTKIPPVVVATWPKRPGEVVRVAIDVFKGRSVVDIRCWYEDRAGELKPTRSGITLGLAHVIKLRAAINATYDEAQRLGLLDHESVERDEAGIRDGGANHG